MSLLHILHIFLRFLTVALDKHASAYADKRKGLVAEAKTKKKETASS